MKKFDFIITFIWMWWLATAAYPQEAKPQNILQFDPSLITLHAIEPPNFYNAERPIRLSIFSPSSSWDLSCILEIIAQDKQYIPLERIYIRREGEKEYQPMITAIHIGSGEATAIVQELAAIYLRVQVVDTDPAGIYQGSIKFFRSDDKKMEALAVLPIIVTIEPYIKLNIENKKPIYINVTGMPGMYDAEEDLCLIVSSNMSRWKIEASITGTYGSSRISGSNFFIFSSKSGLWYDEGAGKGYLHLQRKPYILTGEKPGEPVTTMLRFKIKTSWDMPPGLYQAQTRFSAENFPAYEDVEVNIDVKEFLTIELSDNQVNIRSTGPPDDYEGDRVVSLKVASNTEQWEAHAIGENLISENDEIPAERVFIFSENKNKRGFMPLNVAQIIATGKNTELADASRLKFKVRTSWEDRAGNYTGKVYVTVIATP